MFTIAEWLLAAAYGLSAGIHAYKRDWPQVLTRILLMASYLYLQSHPAFELAQARALLRYFILLLPTVEILSFVAFKILVRRNARTHD